MTRQIGKTKAQIEDEAIRRDLFVAANGPDPEAARAALDNLRRLYSVRLPLVEARLHGNGRRHA
jgi:hypothetical protein